MRKSIKKSSERVKNGGLSVSWKMLLGVCFLITQMSLVSSKVEGVLGEAYYDYDRSSPDILTVLLTDNGGWGEIEDEVEPLRSGLDLFPVSVKPKKHLGSIAKSSGLRFPLHSDVVRLNTLGRMQLVPSWKRGIPPPLRVMYGAHLGRILNGGDANRQKKGDSDAKLSHDDDSGRQKGESNFESEFYEGPFPMDSVYDEDGGDEGPLRSKRFMGSLARGGWFPRQFRGYGTGTQWEKRHVGSFARLGWMPHSKATHPFGRDVKRTLASIRKSQARNPLIESRVN